MKPANPGLATWLLVLALPLAACSGGGASRDTTAAAAVPADAPGHRNQVPTSPAPDSSRAGQVYDVFIQARRTGDTVAFTVHEPAVFEGGKKYPLVFHGHGVQGSRQKSCVPVSTGSIDPQNPAGSDFINVCAFAGHGFGVVSIDQRAHGQSNGTQRAMDPDFEGQDMLAMLDWAEARLDWLAYGPSADGSDPHNLLLGTVGGSYGGLFQFLLNNIDPRRRVDAMVPEYSPYDLVYSIQPQDVLKTNWNLFLIGVVNATGLPTASTADPFMRDEVVKSLAANRLTSPLVEFLTYHSPRYFCEGLPVATNGVLDGQPLVPQHPPVAGPKVHALIWQGPRDTIFNLNEAYRHYQCLQARGGDVRLYTYQRAHNALPVTLDAGDPLYQPPVNMFATDCGGTDVQSASLAFFDRYLKGIPDAIAALPQGPCLSLSAGDSVLVDHLTTGHEGRARPIPASRVVAGVADIPTIVDLGMVAGADGEVLGGLPQLEVDVESLQPGLPGEPIIFFGLGQVRAARPETHLLPDLVENQLTPLRGTGPHAVEMAGVAERLAPGDRLVLLIYGGHSGQYGITGSVNIAQPTVMPLSVSGKVWLPLLGPLPPVPRSLRKLSE